VAPGCRGLSPLHDATPGRRQRPIPQQHSTRLPRLLIVASLEGVGQDAGLRGPLLTGRIVARHVVPVNPPFSSIVIQKWGFSKESVGACRRYWRLLRDAVPHAPWHSSSSYLPAGVSVQVQRGAESRAKIIHEHCVGSGSAGIVCDPATVGLGDLRHWAPSPIRDGGRAAKLVGPSTTGLRPRETAKRRLLLPVGVSSIPRPPEEAR